MSKFASYSTIKDCIYGHAVGDALGLPVQFKSRATIALNPVTSMIGHGVFNMPEGSWSDDTSMTLCALDALANDDFSFDIVMENFILWIDQGKFTPFGFAYDIGATCIAAINNYAQNRNYLTCGLTGDHDNGNGSLMRIIPFALFNANDADFIETASALTHAHPRAKLACVIYSQYLNSIINTKDKSTLYSVLNNLNEKYGHTNDWSYFLPLYDIESRDIDTIKSSGYVVDTLEAAIYCLMTTDSYSSCVIKAVNLGLDTDTVAAVAGGLAGALYGYNSIPADWIDNLKSKDILDSLCKKAGF